MAELKEDTYDRHSSLRERLDKLEAIVNELSSNLHAIQRQVADLEHEVGIGDRGPIRAA